MKNSFQFQFPPLREGRHCAKALVPSVFNFNSRPCARGDSIGSPVRSDSSISIPAPARGATSNTGCCCSNTHISIPAPARGATQLVPGRFIHGPDFNSRPCARGDDLAGDERHGGHISIPAPARGATLMSVPLMVSRKYFNSRPCARGDVAHYVPFTEIINFNSRPCARGDPSPYDIALSQQIFQFPPLREGRPCGSPSFL